MERDPGKTWRRAALQILLYGGEHYHSLLGGFPSFFRNRELSKAATQVQRHFRERKLRKLMRTLRSGKESAESNRRQAQEAAELKSACVMQAAYRGHLVRKALRGISGEAKQTALDDLRRHKSEHEELKRRTNAAKKIQSGPATSWLYRSGSSSSWIWRWAASTSSSS